MTKVTIKYNIRERGRTHRGQPRNFDLASLARVLNSPEVQERVRKRDLVGYFGHGARLKFGMNPGEGGYDQKTGNHIRLVPSHVTTMLRCDDAGNIEHEAEFLPTPPGRAALLWHEARVGGFSTAITCDESASQRLGCDVTAGFYGFDYVSEPNYSSNRGFALDGVARTPEQVLLDAVFEDEQATVQAFDSVYGTLKGEYDALAQTCARMAAENAELVAIIAARPAPDQAAARRTLEHLDSAVFQRTGARRPGPSLLDLAHEFSSMELAGFEPMADAKLDATERNLGGLITTLIDRIR